MAKKLYQEMASLIQARQNCINKGNTEWQGKHEKRLCELLDELPHGSGLDYTWHYDFNKSNQDKIVLLMSFHAMDENGYYDAVIDFKVTITASLSNDINMVITGNFGKYQDIKDYLYDILQYALTSGLKEKVS